MSNLSHLSASGIEAIRAAFLGKVELRASDLVDQVEARGFKRQHIYHLVPAALAAGMLRRLGRPPHHSYTLVEGWEPNRLPRPIGSGGRRDHYERQDQEPATPYEGPAFGAGALVQSVGMVCGETQEEREGELPPWLGGRIVDSLHRRFDEIFGGVE